MSVQTFTRPATQAASNESAQSRLARHGGLKAAREKLSELEAGKAAVEAGIARHKSALSDTATLSEKLMNGEPIELNDTFNSEAENAKLAGYTAAIQQQRRAIEQELRSASRDVCDSEAPGHKQQVEKLIEQANGLISTFNGMERRVAELRNAGVLIDNRFPLFDGIRFRTILHQVSHIVGQFETFVK